jgi:zinc transport system substrate-binding protein
MRNFLCALGVCLAAGCSKQSDSAGPLATPMPNSAAHNNLGMPANEVPAGHHRLLVMATIAPMYCFTKNVVGDLADVEMIVPPGMQAHAFVPSPDDVQEIMRADMVIENGFGFENWMDRLEAQGLKQGAIRVIAARGTGPGIPGLPGDPNSPPSGEPDLSGGPADPHVWLDPMMAIKEVQNIRDALMTRDPANANTYLANENRYEAALRDLDDQVGRVTVEIVRRRLLCPEPTFNYFLSQYEFPVVEKPESANAVLLSPGEDAADWKAKGLTVIRADPMESGSATTDFYEKQTLANAQALKAGLMQ